MIKNLKKQQSTMIGFLIAFMMISVGFFTGCTSNNNQGTYVLFTSAQHEILESVNSEYATLIANRSAQDARAELVNRLNSNYEEVTSAELGDDNYTIFIDFSNGRCVAFDTFDSSEYNESAVLFEDNSNASGQGSGQYGDYAMFFDGETKASPVQDQGSSVYSPLSLSEDPDLELPLDKITCRSKKVIILTPSGYEGVTAHYQCEAYFKDHGWKDEDITIKANMENISMDMRPEDFFHLDEYGIILVFAHGGIKKSTDEKQMWLECCTLDNETIRENKVYQQWFDDNILITRIGFRPVSKNETDTVNTTNVHWYYSIMISIDMLRQNIGSLPDSFVHLATCYSAFFKDAFVTNGAKIVLSWNRAVYRFVADTNQVHMVKCMLEKNYSVYSGYQDNTVIRSYIDYWTTKHLLIEFLLYPLPNESSIAESFYFPAWIDTLNVTNIPDEADTVSVTLSYGAGNILKSESYNVRSSNLTIEDLDDIMFCPTATPTIQVRAFDNSQLELTNTQSTIVLSMGANNADVRLSYNEDRTHVESEHGFSDYGWNQTIDLSVSSNKWEEGKDITVTAILTVESIGEMYASDVPGFSIELWGSYGEVVAYDPPFINGSDNGSFFNGRIPSVFWSGNRPNGYRISPATFSVTFRLDHKEDERLAFIDACSDWCVWRATCCARIYLR